MSALSNLSFAILLAAANVSASPPEIAAPFTPAPLPLPPALQQSLPQPNVAAACCKTCRKGKACGDSCIARDKTCHKPPGCACDAGN